LKILVSPVSILPTPQKEVTANWSLFCKKQGMHFANALEAKKAATLHNNQALMYENKNFQKHFPSLDDYNCL
jgi:hypothetical protein